jgi:thiamine biosynthesis lipoprotein
MTQEHSTVSLNRVDDYFLGSFIAMASPCVVLIDTDHASEAEEALNIAECEAHRIELKFSRYRSDNLIHQINHAEGRCVQVDEETALLIDYAATCYEMSDRMFDITSGILRKVWKFDGGHQVPCHEAVEALLPMIGWERVQWSNRGLTLPRGMEIDLGGIGKEYAVDRASARIAQETDRAFVVNFGGDLYASGIRRGNRAWGVGIDDPDRSGRAAVYRLEISHGGLATSGDARRYVLWNGLRLGHILNPRTGWPIENAPRSVTVLGVSCMEAGTLSTLAYLRGPSAGKFLEEQGVPFWIL